MLQTSTGKLLLSGLAFYGYGFLWLEFFLVYILPYTFKKNTRDVGKPLSDFGKLKQSISSAVKEYLLYKFIQSLTGSTLKPVLAVLEKLL